MRTTVLITIAVAAGLAFAQAPRGPQLSAEGLSERLEDRIAEVERALAEMKRVRGELEAGGEPQRAVRDLLAIQRGLAESGPLGDAVRRRGGDGRRGFLGDRGRDADRRPGDRPEPPETEVTDEAVLEFAREHLPEVRLWLEKLRAVDAPLTRRMSRRIMDRIGEILRTEPRDETLGALMLRELKAELDIMRTVRGARGTGFTNEVRATLRAALGAKFDAHVALRRYEIVRAAERLERLEAEIREHEAGREVFLDERVEDMGGRIRDGRIFDDRGERGAGRGSP